MKDIVLALFTGMVMGGVFSLMHLPSPAPQTAAGIVGIAGIFIGYVLVQTFVK